MGHTSIKTTMDLYGHLLPGLGQEMADRLDVARWLASGAFRTPGVRPEHLTTSFIFVQESSSARPSPMK